MAHPLVDTVRRALATAADPAKAAPMQAYMKSHMPFRGVPAPVLTATLRPILADPAYRLEGRADWETCVRDLWDAASYREERYAAIALSGHRLYRPHQTPSAVPLYRHLVVTGAWWDYVDQVASRRIGPILRAFPGTEQPRMREWAADDHLWVRRTAILSQLTFKDATDRELLMACIAPNLDSREPFIAKAVGWALRQYAHSGAQAAAWVRETTDRYAAVLAPLARREALKPLHQPTVGR